MSRGNHVPFLDADGRAGYPRERERGPHVSTLGSLSASWAVLGRWAWLGSAGRFLGRTQERGEGTGQREARIARGQAGAPRLLQQMPRLGADLAVLGMSWRGLARM